MKSQIQFIALAAVIALSAGCASTGYEKADATSASLQKTAKRMDLGTEQLDIVLTNLSELVNSPAPDLKPQYKKFSASMKDLESLAKSVSNDASTMESKGAAYFDQWDLELAKIHNEDIRSRSADRKDLMAGQFDQVKASYLEVKKDFAPFLSDLEDIRTALATDLTTGGLNSIKSVADKANEDAVPLRNSLEEMSANFKALGVSLSATNLTE